MHFGKIRMAELKVLGVDGICFKKESDHKRLLNRLLNLKVVQSSNCSNGFDG
jgi:hypothetical protein